MALITGLKHYLGGHLKFMLKKEFLPETPPIREEHPRLSLPKLLLRAEDEVYKASKRDGFTWSILGLTL